MHRNTLAIVIAASLITNLAGMEQKALAAVTSIDRHVPLPTGVQSIEELQTKLNEKGFSPGRIDGLWGPDTAAALKRFQAANSLHASGSMDRATSVALGLSVVAASPAAVPPVAAIPAAGTPTAAVPTPATAPAVAADRTLGTNVTGANPGGSNAGANAAKGNDNQAVATTNANAPQPAHGANSFSQGEAGRRISKEGFQSVSELHKDDTGVWRGTAIKGGQHIQVWLDYKGNVGQQ